MAKNKTSSMSKSLSDAFFQLNSASSIQIVAGCTQTQKISGDFISLRKLLELNTIDQKELFIEFGSAVTLSQMLSETKTPKIVRDAIKTIGTETVRNIATLGGNICAKDFRHTLWAPLLALNARLEIRNASEIFYLPFNKFTEIPEKHILTKVRFPRDEWEIEIFKRTGPSNTIGDLSASFVFLAGTQRGLIANIRIVFAGKTLFYSPEFESRIIGTRLPISEKTIIDLVSDAEKIYDENNPKTDLAPILKTHFLNLLRNSLEQLI